MRWLAEGQPSLRSQSPKPALLRSSLAATVMRKDRGIGTSLEVQWLRIFSQCRGHGFDSWMGN